MTSWQTILNISIFSACEKFILGMWRVCNWDLTFDLQTSDLELDRERMTIKTRRRKWMTTWHEPSMPGALTGWGPSIARSSFSRSETKKSRWVDKLSNSVGLLLLRGLPFIPAILLSPPDIGRTLSKCRQLHFRSNRSKDVWRAPQWDKRL